MRQRYQRSRVVRQRPTSQYGQREVRKFQLPMSLPVQGTSPGGLRTQNPERDYDATGKLRLKEGEPWSKVSHRGRAWVPSMHPCILLQTLGCEVSLPSAWPQPPICSASSFCVPVPMQALAPSRLSHHLPSALALWAQQPSSRFTDPVPGYSPSTDAGNKECPGATLCTFPFPPPSQAV